MMRIVSLDKPQGLLEIKSEPNSDIEEEPPVPEEEPLVYDIEKKKRKKDVDATDPLFMEQNLLQIKEETEDIKLEELEVKLDPQLYLDASEPYEQPEDFFDNNVDDNKDFKDNKDWFEDKKTIPASKSQESPERPTKSQKTKPMLSCEICSQVFDDEIRRRFHMQRKHKDENHPFEHQCTKCHLSYEKAVSLRKHMQRKHSKKNKTFKKEDEITECDICHMVYASKNMHAKHLKWVHNIEKPTEKKFSCLLCNEKFAETRSVKSHMDRMHSDPKFSCLTCGRKFNLKESLRRHIYRKHTPANNTSGITHKCSQCDTECNSLRALSEHIFNTHVIVTDKTQDGKLKTDVVTGFNCEHCGKEFLLWNQLQIHLKLVHAVTSTDGLNFQCTHCGVFFVRSDPSSTVFSCDQCRDKFGESEGDKELGNEEKSGLLTESTDKTLGNDSVLVDSNELICPICTHLFADEGRLRLHMRRYHDILADSFRLKCNVCNLSYDREESLKRHYQRKHSNAPEVSHCKPLPVKKEETKVEAQKDGIVTECHICYKVYATRATLERHLKWIHNLVTTTPPKKNEAFCSHCSAGFPSKRMLRYHIEKFHSNKIYPCIKCGARFKLKASYRRHVITKHSSDTKYNASLHMCQHCHEIFGGERELANHVATHNLVSEKEEKIEVAKGPYNCQRCSNVYTTWNELKHHVKRVHCTLDNTNQNFKCQCQYCGVVVTASSFQRHMTKHFPTDETLAALNQFHSCPVCDFKTRQKGNLKTHMRIHTKEKPFVCGIDDCQFRSTTKGNINIHRLTHNKDKHMLQCSTCTFRSVNKYVMKGHEEEHKRIVTTGLKKYKCDQCDYSTSFAPNLTMHKQKHSTEKTFQCQFCPFATKYTVSLRSHLKRKHGTRAASKLTYHSPFVPEQIESDNSAVSSQLKEDVTSSDQQVFASGATLESHLKWIHNFVTTPRGKVEAFCTYCNIGFPTKRNLRYHNEKFHTNTMFTCVHCGAVFKLKGTYRKHVTRKHASEIIYNTALHKCSQCEEICMGERELANHIASQHPVSDVKSED